jgi:ABC-type sugar transport system ATPase subunit
LVSHNLDEVRAHADEISVFRKGRHIARRPVGEWSKESMVAAMVGEVKARSLRYTLTTGLAEAAGPANAGPGAQPERPVALRASVSIPGRLQDVQLDVRAGEMLGIAGLAGAGRSSLLRALAGLEPRARGRLTIGDSEPVSALLELLRWPAR